MTVHVVRLNDVCELNPRMPKMLADEEIVSFLPMAAVSESGHIDFEERREAREVKKGYTYFQRGDVLVAKITPCFENGKATRTKSLTYPIGFGSTEFHVLRPGESLDPSYLFHLIWNSKFRELGARNMAGSAGQKRVPADFLQRLEIPLPPLQEQRRIAAILDKADALRRKRKRALDVLDSLTQSIFLEMFGDPVSNPKGWPTQEFGQLVVNESSKRVPIKNEHRDIRSGIYPYYGASGIIDYIDGYIFDGRRLLIAEDGANLLSRSTPIAFFADGKFWVNNHAHVLAEAKNCSLTFLRSYIETIDLAPYVTGSAQPKLNRANLDKIAVRTPPVDLQREYESRIGQTESLGTGMTRTASLENSLFASLQHRAFSGQL